MCFSYILLDSESVQTNALIFDYDLNYSSVVIVKEFIAIDENLKFSAKAPYKCEPKYIENRIPSKYQRVFVKDEKEDKLIPVKFPLQENFSLEIFENMKNWTDKDSILKKMIPLKSYNEFYFVLNDSLLKASPDPVDTPGMLPKVIEAFKHKLTSIGEDNLNRLEKEIINKYEKDIDLVDEE